MCSELTTLPLRIGACATRLAVHVTGRAAGMVFGGARHILEAALAGDTSDRAAADEARAAARGAKPRKPPTTSRPDVAAAISQAQTGPSPAASGPVPATAAPPTHVSEELEFVEGFAEPGAEEGAGAEVHVMEPWNGYAHLTANEIIAKLDDATREELAAVLLYERVHRCRRTVLAAAERQLARASEEAEHARARH